MSDLTQEQVEKWLDDNPDACSDYFLRKVDVNTVNAWLVSHGYTSVTRFLPPENDDNGPFAVSFRKALAKYLAGAPNTEKMKTYRLPLGDDQNTSTSKVHLRQDFAKSKNLHKTPEPSTSEPSDSRRDSLVDTRKCISLPPTAVNMLSLLIESKVKLPKGFPFQSKEVKRNMRKEEGEHSFFLNIVRDITSELDITSLNVKAAENLAVLLESDGASLYVTETRLGKQTLVSRYYHVDDQSDSSDPAGEQHSPEVGERREIVVSSGSGILGYVAKSGETVNAKVASQDPHFDVQIDKIAGIEIETLLCMPVKNADNEIIAVVQVVNKNKQIDGGYFTDDDESKLKSYLQFVGVAVTNAQLMSASRNEYERNRNLFEVVHDLFEQQTSLEKVTLKIMQRAQKLTGCEKAAILLLEDTSENAAFVRLFQMNSNSSDRAQTPQEKEHAGAVVRYLLGLAHKVVKSGQVMNIAEAVNLEQDHEGIIKNLLAMPIRNSRCQIIGVVNILDKPNQVRFDDNDEQLFEAFTIFCGLAIHNTLMFSEIEKAMAKQKVALEVLSYHVSASNKEVEAHMGKPVPCAYDLHLYSLSFDDFSLDPHEMVNAAASMFLELGLVQRFNIEKNTLYRFLMSVKKNYRDVPYHNWRHAFNVSQFMFAILMGCEMKDTFSELEVLGMFVGCLCHDLDHRGTNNSFQLRSKSPLVLLYGTTNTLEHHHFNHAVMILSAEGNNIFSSLSSEEYSKVIEILQHSILATDLIVYSQNRNRFFELVKTKTYSWEIDDHRELLRSMLMTASDVAASCKPWKVQKKVAKLVTSEFFEQGDKEREMHLIPLPLMDRKRRHELPQIQINWMTDVCIPLYESLGEMNPKLSPICEGVIENRKQWQKIIDENRTLTWDQDEENT